MDTLTVSIQAAYCSAMTSSAANQAIAKFMRTLAAAAMELAGELEMREHLRSVGEAGLGTLQRAIAEALTQATADTGLSASEVAHLLRRGDEPNVRTALNRLRDRGIAELIPDLPTQRWRLATTYRED